MRARPWLIASVGLNLFLAAGFYIATMPLLEPDVVPSAPDTGPYLKTNVVVRHENFTWEQIESPDFPIFIKNLRAIGCPEQIVRDIIISEVDRVFARRRLEEVVFPNYEWWRSKPDAAAVQAASAKLAALENERQKLLTSLLGSGWDAPNNELIAANGGITLTGPVLGNLSAALRQTVYRIAAAAQLKIDAYQDSQHQLNQPVDPMEMVRLREEPLAQLAAVLTPEQYEEYALRYSPSAEQLRGQMSTANLSSDQFREVFNAINSINGQPIFYYNGSDPQLLAAQKQLQAQSDAIIKETLGDSFYAAYQLNQDPLYRASLATAQQLGVPATSIMPIYEINRATQSELDRIRKDTTMTPDEKVEAIAQTQVEQQQSIGQILGPDAFERWLSARANQ
jgi:hypothetical protein